MRVLFALHATLEPNAGLAGAQLALAHALRARGWTTDFFAYDQAYPGARHLGARHQLAFPWLVARELARRARGHDILDVTTGDAWLWAALGRPGASREQALVTRSHGLEQTADRARRAGAKAGRERLSWKYPLYHGGLRLWEVGRSLRLADACILLNAEDGRLAVEELGVAPERAHVIGNGIHPSLLGLPAPAVPTPGPLRLAWVGSWVERKGTATLSATLTRLDAAGVDYRITLFGTGVDERAVHRALGELTAWRAQVVPFYRREQLPALLAGHEVLVMPSEMEGSSLALLEAMACGLVPVTTPVGAAAEVIAPERDGLLVPVGDASAMARAIGLLAANPATRVAMRRQAHATAQQHGWDTIAEATERVYHAALVRRGRTLPMPSEPVGASVRG